MAETQNQNPNSIPNWNNWDITQEVIKLAEKIKDEVIKEIYLWEIEKISNQKWNIENQIQKNTKEELEKLKKEIEAELLNSWELFLEKMKILNFLEKNSDILKWSLFDTEKKEINENDLEKISWKLAYIWFDNLKEIFSLKDKPEEMVKKINELNNKYNEEKKTPRLFTDLKETLTEIFPFVQQNITKVEIWKIWINEKDIEKIKSKLNNENQIKELNIQLLLFEKLENNALKQELQSFWKDIIQNLDDKEKHQKNIQEFLNKLKNAELPYKQKLIMYSIIYNLSTIFGYTNEAEKIAKNKGSFETEIKTKYNEIKQNNKDYLRQTYWENSNDDNLTQWLPNIYEIAGVVDFYNQDHKPEDKKENKSDSEKTNNLKSMWIPINENWEIDMKKWEKIKIWENKTATLELTSTWDFFITNQLWYNFKYTNINSNKEESPKISQDEMSNFYEITRQMNILDRAWFWYFWDNFRVMMDLISVNSRNTWLWAINIQEWVWYQNDFLSEEELKNVFTIFNKMGLVDNPNNYHKPEVMSKTTFTQKIQEIREKTEPNVFFDIDWNITNQKSFKLFIPSVI